MYSCTTWTWTSTGIFIKTPDVHDILDPVAVLDVDVHQLRVDVHGKKSWTCQALKFLQGWQIYSGNLGDFAMRIFSRFASAQGGGEKAAHWRARPTACGAQPEPAQNQL